MEHTHIIKSGDLSRYADTRDSQGVIPELVYLLIRQSVSDMIECRIPYGDAVNQPGLDGLVNCKNGYLQFIPDGISCWEIGTGGNPQDKATDDFRKRTKKVSDSERAASSFVFVTPRSAGANGWEEPEQTAWIKRRQNRGWKQIRIIDGVKLADWLREFPALGRWMASKIGITPSLGGIITPLEHWSLILSQGERTDPPLPPALFTTSRDGACAAIEAVFSGVSKRLFLFAESEHDVDDFVAAYLSTLEEAEAQEYANRCLFIKDENAWRTVSELRQSHILVASPRLGLDSERQDLQAVATGRGHGVIIPLCGTLSDYSPEIIKLRSPSQSQIEAVLKAANFSDIRARELGGIGGGRLSALRRHFLGLGSVPPYVTWDTARELARACLVGQWNAKNPVDVRALEGMLGKGYGEWIEILRVDTLRSDSPLIQTDEKWRFVARSEAWSALGNRITDEDLDRLKATAVFVLGERDPKFDLPKEQRFAASIHGKQLEHSQHLRKGIVETLALVGSRSQALSSCSLGKAETTAVLVVRTLLNQANWERWASLDSHLPLLAEAAPDEFLDAVESVLVDLPNSPFHEIFAQEGSGGFGGWNYMSGLLWALEGLAWHPDYLSRVAVILADIASIDPGGNWANRPANSLVDIFMPWHIQTTASFDKRKAAIQTILREQPKVGWSLLLALLPHSHGVTSGCHRPVWRDFIPRDWKEGVLKSEYWEQIIALTELAVELAKEDSERLVELVNRLSDLPKSAQDSILNHLSSDGIVSLPEPERLPVWDKLDKLVRRHRKFFDADWALPEETVAKIEGTAKLLIPSSPELKYHHLFNDRDFDLFNEKGNYEEQRKRLNVVRQAAVSEILGNGNLTKCLGFAKKVASPYEVGRALGVIASDDIEDAILPALLDSGDDTEARVVAGFVWARFWNLKIGWVDTVLKRDWNPEHRAKFLTLLSFDEEIWERVSSNLGEAHEALYWRNAQVNPYGQERDLTFAIEKLLTYRREGAAVMCVACTADDTSRFDETLATRSLIAVLDSEDGIKELDNYDTVELIKRLQKSETADQDALFRIEWNFLPWLDRFSSGSPITLEKRLASDPAFFAEAVRLVFRSKKDSDDCAKENDEQRQHLVRNAYKLLTEWKYCPGIKEDGTLDVKAFNEWINETRRITEETGHAEVAQIQIGHMLTCAPPDPGGLWIHEAVATVLNYRDTGRMRSGFTTELFNQRGVYNFTHGQEERELAKQNREKAEALDTRGFTRFATAMREFAEQYNREAELEEKRDLSEE
ncbi:hypothetical protein DesLBE_4674 [Desulfitobacterium sp. LBE]|uniref:hypothetical protein n=1 Tax=Desulfitobacterium sp. LBE TaxID=884086 RepID=UPI001199BA53|nr:hypothetical protein [Desulfitobacterium sp. LBE]TWH60249.1 hypothetical protein DesLBE_4674 [Desulfitobacterium sp. LBE]